MPDVARPYSAPKPVASSFVSVSAVLGMSMRISPPRRCIEVSTPSM